MVIASGVMHSSFELLLIDMFIVVAFIDDESYDELYLLIYDEELFLVK
jgi:hypothetical protein